MGENPCMSCRTWDTLENGLCRRCNNDKVRFDAMRRRSDPTPAERMEDEISTLRSRLAVTEAALDSEREARERAERELAASLRFSIYWNSDLEKWVVGNIYGYEHCQAQRLHAVREKLAELDAAREKGKEGGADGN